MCVYAGNSEGAPNQCPNTVNTCILNLVKAWVWPPTVHVSVLLSSVWPWEGSKALKRVEEKWEKLGHWVTALEEIDVFIVSSPVSSLERAVLQTMNPASPKIWIPVLSCDLSLPLLTSTMLPPAITWWPDVRCWGSHLKWANAYGSPLNLQSCGISKYHFEKFKDWLITYLCVCVVYAMCGYMNMSVQICTSVCAQAEARAGCQVPLISVCITALKEVSYWTGRSCFE